ncbi:MAG TPA: GNAT family protein [Gaiellaceae bacterium]|nr:GNAT family protein [Gaiellaceae bacterium]
MWDGLATRLEGRIVVVEPLAPQHEEGLWAAAQAPAIWRWMPWEAAADRESFARWHADALARSKAGLEAAYAVLSAVTGEGLGSTRYLNPRPEHLGVEIGWTWLSPSAWGTGANTEAKLLLLHHAFEALGCMRVEFKTDARNERSRAALAALPARFEGVFAKHMLVRGGDVRDSAWYAIVDDDWPAVRANLERRLGAR